MWGLILFALGTLRSGFVAEHHSARDRFRAPSCGEGSYRTAMGCLSRRLDLDQVCRSPSRGAPEIAAQVWMFWWYRGLGTIALNRCCQRRISNRPAVIHSCGGLGPRPSREGIRSALTRGLVSGFWLGSDRATTVSSTISASYEIVKRLSFGRMRAQPN
jgi:hypothetical protein